MNARTIVAGLGAVALLGSIALAQGGGQDKPQAVIMKGKAPVSNQILQVKLPRPHQAQLSNGLHVMVLEDHRAPQVTMQLIIRGAGGHFDPPNHFGLAQFTAANLREGTPGKTSAASWITSSRPIPVPPPVTTASFPSNDCILAPFGQPET